MSARFQQNLLFLLTLNLVVKPFWILGIDRVVQNRLGEETYGLYFSLTSLAMVLGILQDIGLTTFTNRHISQNIQLFKTYFPKLLGLKIIISLVAFCFVWVLGWLLGYAQTHPLLLLFILVNQTLLSLILFARANLGALQLFKKDSIISVLDRLFLIAFCLVLLYTSIFSDQITLLQFVLAQTLGYFFTLLIAIGFLTKKNIGFSIQFSKTFSIVIMKSAMPFALLFFLMYLYTRMDAIMIEKLHFQGSFEAGIYAKGYRILDAVNMLSYLFSVILLPTLARMLKEKISVATVTHTATKLLIFPLITATAILAFYNNFFMHGLYLKSNVYQNQVFVLVTLNIVPMGLVYIFGTLLTSGKQLRFLNTVAALGLIVNFGLNFSLIPKYGAWGAAIATLITQSTASLAQLVFALKKYQIQFPSQFLWQILLFLPLLVLAFIALNSIEIATPFKVGIMLFVSVVYLFLSKAFTMKDLKQFAPSFKK